MEKETNLFDLLKSGCHGIIHAVKKCWCLLGKMMQITFQQWWVVFPIIILFIIAGAHYSRKDNRIYKVNAIAVLNGPTTGAVTDYFQALNHTIDGCTVQNRAQLLNLDALTACRLSHFKTFYVIDSKDDGMADFVDYKHKSKPQDTINVRMPNMIALQFRTKDIEALPEIEQHILAYFNSNEQFQKAYETASVSVERRHQFDIEQMEKLDSLTSAFYFDQKGQDATKNVSIDRWNSALVVGDRRITLFLDEIDEFFAARQSHEQTYTYREAPVVLINHFVALGRPVNGRLKCLIIAILIGWIIGCILGIGIKDRKKVIAFLKQ
ncbi:MAG: hypothetical protein MJZ75_02625 [Paludibacteraceae bacterium]|nr:hypothetical protein [Paludibacteraceae bacterium]